MLQAPLPPIVKQKSATDEEINQMFEAIIDADFIKQSTQSESSFFSIKNVESEAWTMTHSSTIVESDS